MTDDIDYHARETALRLAVDLKTSPTVFGASGEDVVAAAQKFYEFLTEDLSGPPPVGEPG